MQMQVSTAPSNFLSTHLGRPYVPLMERVAKAREKRSKKGGALEEKAYTTAAASDDRGLDQVQSEAARAAILSDVQSTLGLEVGESLREDEDPTRDTGSRMMGAESYVSQTIARITKSNSAPLLAEIPDTRREMQRLKMRRSLVKYDRVLAEVKKEEAKSCKIVSRRRKVMQPLISITGCPLFQGRGDHNGINSANWASAAEARWKGPTFIRAILGPGRHCLEAAVQFV